MSRYYTAKECAQAKMQAGAPFKVGSTLCRWHERPDDIARRVGFADEIRSDAWYRGRLIDHCGWWLDDERQDEVARGVVFRLTRGRGFLYGIADPTNDGPAFLACDIADDLADAIRWSDHLAERYAEDERDYRRASSARMRHDSAGEEVATLRQQALALIHEVKAARAALCDAPAIIAALRDRISTICDDIRDLRRERDQLAADYSREAGWRDA